LFAKPFINSQGSEATSAASARVQEFEDLYYHLSSILMFEVIEFLNYPFPIQHSFTVKDHTKERVVRLREQPR
jgi:hypothetical protein